MKKYIFKIYWDDDDSNVWIKAKSKEEAIRKLEREYPKIIDYELLRVE